MRHFVRGSGPPNGIGFRFLASGFRLVVQYPRFLTNRFIRFRGPCFSVLRDQVKVTRFLVQVLFRGSVRDFHFFVRVFFGISFAPTGRTLKTRPMAADSLQVLRGRVVIHTGYGTSAQVPFRGKGAPSFLYQVRMCGAVAVTGIRQRCVKDPVHVNRSRVASVALLGNHFGRFFINVCWYLRFTFLFLSLRACGFFVFFGVLSRSVFITSSCGGEGIVLVFLSTYRGVVTGILYRFGSYASRPAPGGWGGLASVDATK